MPASPLSAPCAHAGGACVPHPPTLCMQEERAYLTLEFPNNAQRLADAPPVGTLGATVAEEAPDAKPKKSMDGRKSVDGRKG